METLEHAGVTYVKVTTLAKKFKYTADYIGQLCRTGKVDCQLVGRAWFVSESSLVAHKSDRYKQSLPPEVLSKINVIPVMQDAEKTSVYPTLSKHVHKHFEERTFPVQKIQGGSQLSYNKTSYLSDDSSTHLRVLPVAKEKPFRHTESAKEEIKVVAEHITIRNDSKKVTKLTFSPLPEVSLRGTIAVKSLDTEDKYQRSEPVRLLDFPPESFTSNPLPRVAFKSEVVTVPSSARDTRHANLPISTGAFSSELVSPDVSHKKLQLGPLFLPLVVVVSASCTLALLSFSTLVVSDGFVIHETWQLNVAQAITAISFFFETTL